MNSKEKANEHLNFINKKKKNEIDEAIASSYIFDNEKINIDSIIGIKPRFDETYVRLCGSKTVNALFWFMKDSSLDTGILNFSSYTNPGGLFLKGATAQEEHLCLHSLLYPVLESFNKSFYVPNKLNDKSKGLYTNKGIYSRNVEFYTEPDKNFRLYVKKADVCTCAAPNLRYFKRANSIKEKDINFDEIYDIFYRRIFSILYQFYLNGKETLILGAYGCGVFENPPQLVADAFYSLLLSEEAKFKNCFNKVIFAIPDRNSINYKEFKKFFREYNISI